MTQTESENTFEMCLRMGCNNQFLPMSPHIGVLLYLASWACDTWKWKIIDWWNTTCHNFSSFYLMVFFIWKYCSFFHHPPFILCPSSGPLTSYYRKTSTPDYLPQLLHLNLVSFLSSPSALVWLDSLKRLILLFSMGCFFSSEHRFLNAFCANIKRQPISSCLPCAWQPIDVEQQQFRPGQMI
jgi:hypothetical protein